MGKFAILLLVLSFFWCISTDGGAMPEEDSLPRVERKGNVVTLSYTDPKKIEKVLLKYSRHVRAAFTFRVSAYGIESKMVLITDLKEGEEPYKEGRLGMVEFDPSDYEMVADELNDNLVRTAVITTHLAGDRLLLYLFYK